MPTTLSAVTLREWREQLIGVLDFLDTWGGSARAGRLSEQVLEIIRTLTETINESDSELDEQLLGQRCNRGTPPP